MSETVAERLKRFDGDLDAVVEAVNTLEQRLKKQNDEITKLKSNVNDEITKLITELTNRITKLEESFSNLEERITKSNSNFVTQCSTKLLNKNVTSVGRKAKTFAYKGEQLTYQDIAQRRNVSTQSVKNAVSKGILDPTSEQSIAAYLKETE